MHSCVGHRVGGDQAVTPDDVSGKTDAIEVDMALGGKFFFQQGANDIGHFFAALGTTGLDAPMQAGGQIDCQIGPLANFVRSLASISSVLPDAYLLDFTRLPDCPILCRLSASSDIAIVCYARLNLSFGAVDSPTRMILCLGKLISSS